jgi:hypothetical protein
LAVPRRRLLLAVAGALLLAGCGADGASDSASTAPARTATDAVAPATGATIAGTGYELHAAKGWVDVKQQLSPRSDVILATQSGSVMNVLREKIPAGSNRSVVLVALGDKVLEGAGARRLSASTPTAVDGAQGITFRVRIKTDLGPAPGRIVIVLHGGYAYAVAANTSPDEPASMEHAFASMLSSWRWT